MHYVSCLHHVCGIRLNRKVYIFRPQRMAEGRNDHFDKALQKSMVLRVYKINNELKLQGKI